MSDTTDQRRPAPGKRGESSPLCYRILYHHRTQALDGQRVHIREIQQALRDRGHEVVEVAPLSGTESAGEPTAPSLQRRLLSAVVESTPAGLYELLELGYNVTAYRHLANAIQRRRPDFIYERYAANTVAGTWAARRFGVPLVLEVNSPLADEKKALGKLMFYRTARRLERYAVTNAARTLAVTGVLKRMLVNGTGVAESRVRVIQNGVDVARFEAAAARRHEVRRRLGVTHDVVIGAVGFFREWHGIERAITALQRMCETRAEARLLLVGDGPAVPALRRLAQTLALGDRVLFLGSVPHQDVPELTAAADVMLIPRAVEYASPLKLFEYMAMERAIIAPRQPNLQEILTDGVDVLFFTPEDQPELEAALFRLVRDERLRHELGRAARHTIDLKNLTWAGNAARIVEAFEEVRREHVAAGVLARSSV